MGFRGTNRDYAARVVWADESLGALYTYLKDVLNILENTIIIVLNDHGMGAKGSLYERGTRTFQFVRYPQAYTNCANGEIIDDFVISGIDMAPTLMEFAGIDLQDVINDGYVLDGKSWKNGIFSVPRNNAGFRKAISEFYQSRGVVLFDDRDNRTYKYIWRATSQYTDYESNYPDQSEIEQLYDLTLNPKETVSRHDNRNYGNILDDLRQIMIDHVENTCPTNETPCRTPQLSTS